MAENREIAQRLQDARAHAGYDRPSDAAEAMGIPKPTYLAHENGSRGFKREAERYADFFRVDLTWLLTGKGQRRTRDARPASVFQRTNAQVLDDFTPIGRFDASFSMGPGALAAEHPEPLGYWMLESQWLRALTHAKPEQLAIVRADGDSMEPTLRDGDWVLIDRIQTRLSREGIYAIRVGDDTWIKRLSLNLRTKSVRIISDNSSTPVQDIDESELAVIGRVIALVARRVA